MSKSSLARGLSQVNTDIMSVGTRYGLEGLSLVKLDRGTDCFFLFREKMYAQGGIFSITSRILVVDLLSSREP